MLGMKQFSLDGKGDGDQRGKYILMPTLAFDIDHCVTASPHGYALDEVEEAEDEHDKGMETIRRMLEEMEAEKNEQQRKRLSQRILRKLGPE